MPSEGIILGVLGAAVALAGLLLVFVGFVQSKADQTSLAKPRGKLVILSRLGLVPFLSALLCSWQSIEALQSVHWAGTLLFCSLKIVLFLTGLYAIVATFFERFEKVASKWGSQPRVSKT